MPKFQQSLIKQMLTKSQNEQIYVYHSKAHTSELGKEFITYNKDCQNICKKAQISSLVKWW